MARSHACLKDILLDRNDNSAIFSSADGISRILVLDGGVSTHLENLLAQSARGEDLPNDMSTTSISGPSHSTSLIRPSFPHRELWSSSLLLTDQGRRTIRQGHLDWILAGADILSTVTYQCHFNRTPWSEALQNCVTFDVMDDMWRLGISLAREAAEQSHASNSSERRVFVAASLGCYGASLANGAEYTGEYGDQTMENLMQFHRRKLEQAVLNRPDAVAFETIPSVLECQALARLLTSSHGILTPPTTDECDSTCACWISLACRNGDELNDGTPVEAALEVLDDIPMDLVQGVGFNCCESLHLPVLVGRWLDFEAKKCRDRRRALVLYPNSGEKWSADKGTWIPGTGSQSSEDFSNDLWKCVEVIGQHHLDATENADQRQALVLVLGGCCRTSPACIASLRQRVDLHEGGVAMVSGRSLCDFPCR
jgi:homocysteine S-methyltransferase